MRKLFLITLTIISLNTFAQNNLAKEPIKRKGLMLGLGVGAGTLTFKTDDTIKMDFSATFPNIKVGYMLNYRLALLALISGANYKYEGKTRSFEGFTIAGQYWLIDEWWVLGGTGFTFDAPAFYRVKSPKKEKFYKGFPSLTLATGYELWHNKMFTLDIQYRIFIGEVNLPDNRLKEGLSNMFILGFNWY